MFGDGKFTVLEDLIKAVTSIIFISSVGHSAANFAQYDEYAFPPNYPAFLRGKPPTNKVNEFPKLYLEPKLLRLVPVSIGLHTTCTHGGQGYFQKIRVGCAAYFAEPLPYL